MENSLQNSFSFPLRIISLHASEASPPNSDINDRESLAMLPIDFSAVALLPEMRAISERKGWRFTPLNSMSIDGSGTSIPCHPFCLSHGDHSRSSKLDMLLQQQLRAIRNCFQDLMAVTLSEFASHSHMSKIGNGPSNRIPSMEILS